MKTHKTHELRYWDDRRVDSSPMPYSDAYLEYWGDRFQYLESAYGVNSAHQASFEQFLTDPERNEQWIHIYFANPMLFINRSGGGRILLTMLLDVGLNEVLAGIWAVEKRPSIFGHEPLLPRQHRVCAELAQSDECALNEYSPECMGIGQRMDFEEIDDTQSPMRVRGGRLFWPFHNRKPSAKYKTRGAHLLGARS